MKKCVLLFLVLLLCITAPWDFAGAPDTVYAADHVMTQEIVEGPNTPSEDNAYILFRDTPVMNKMSFEDGVGTDRYQNETFNEKIKFNGVEARQVWKENYLYMRFDPDFASPEDSVFRIEIDYWDYSGIGWFFLDYTTAESDTVYSRVSVLKEGNPDGDPQWHRLTILLTDASFRQVMPYGSDLKIVTNAFNAYSKIEVTNLSAAAGDSTEEMGIFNSLQADAMHSLGIYEGIGGEAYDAGLSEFLTQEEFIRCLYQGFGLKETVEAAKVSPKTSGVSGHCAPYVGYAEQQGLLPEDFDPRAMLTQAEMLGYFVRHLGLSGFDADRPMESAREIGLLQNNEAVFQMGKNVTRDNFVGLLGSALLVSVEGKTEPLLEMMERKVFTGDDVVTAGYGRWTNWMLKRGFYAEPTEEVCDVTGRTFYTIDVAGSNAVVNYFTQPMDSADSKKIYFNDKDSNLYEYNMETGMMRFIDGLVYQPTQMAMTYQTVPSNHLYYLNGQQELVKMNCDTYEKTVVAKVPEDQKNVRAGMLQVSFNEKLVSVTWRDQTPGFDNSKYGAMPVLNLETGEWDRSHYYGFDTYTLAANHNSINPYYNYQIFAHEGQGVLDRVWVVDHETDEYYCVSEQKDYNIGTITGDTAGHEFWCSCGLHVGWVASAGWYGRQSVSSDLTGITLCDLDGSNHYTIRRQGTYGYNHASMSPDHRWVVADSSLAVGYERPLHLIDTITGEVHVLAEVRMMDNPGHQHPSFSWDNSKVYFGLASEDYSYPMVGYMDVSDITQRPLPPGGEYELSEMCDTFGYEGFEHYIQPKTDGEGTYYHVPKGNKMYIRTDASVTEERNADISVKVTYLDKGRGNLSIEYCRYDVVGSVARRLENTAYIARKNTGKWKTEEIIIENVDMQNPFNLGADLLISGQLSSADIRSVEVSVVK